MTFDHQLLQTSVAAMAAKSLTDTTVVAPNGATWRIIDLTDSRSGKWIEQAIKRVSAVNLIDGSRPEAACLFPATDPKRSELFILLPAALGEEDFDIVRTVFLTWAGYMLDRQNGAVNITSYGGLATRVEPAEGKQLRARLAGVPIDGKLTPTASPDEWRGRMLPAIRNICEYRLTATEKTVHRWRDPLILVDAPALVVYSTIEGEKAWQTYFSGPMVPIEPIDFLAGRAPEGREQPRV